MICVVCGKTTGEFEFSMKHPCCKECWKKRRKEFERSLKRHHPDLYEVYKNERNKNESLLEN